MMRSLLPALVLLSALAAPPWSVQAAESGDGKEGAVPDGAQDSKAAVAERDPAAPVAARPKSRPKARPPAGPKAEQLPPVTPAATPPAAPAAAMPVVTPVARSEPHWSYEGENGPAAWAQLAPEFAACANGQRQSPIDIRDGIPLELDPVVFDYRDTAFKVIDTGHSIQANLSAGNSIRVSGRRFSLVQLHFHHPSEELIDGHQSDMVIHLVHKDGEGKLAVVAVLLERGARQPEVQTVLNNLPLEKHEEQPAGSRIDPSHLLPEDRRYFTFMGSLTTPPCSEGVLWIVMKKPLTVSQEQIDLFARLYPNNARPVQASAGRMIKESE